jgi:serine phosphatase RsbU (regulator of sigma subunit)
LAGHNAPCRTVGGDYYDFIPYADGRVAVVLGDVAGKGMSAALLMSNLQARVQILAEDPRNLSGLMGRLDQSVAINCPDNRFITMFMGVIDPAEGRLVYCNAGHNPPLLIRSSGEVDRLKAVGTALGILPGLSYQEESRKFSAGDLLAIYSDGLTESENPAGEEFGELRLTELLGNHSAARAEDIVEQVLQALDAWTGSTPPADDITLVVVRATG